MAREMYLAGVSEEELRPDPKPEKPKTPKAWLQNYWYHYKWITLAAVFAAVLLTILIGQLVTRNDPDYTLLLVTEQPYTEDVLQHMEQTLAAYGEDVDGDGKVEVQILNCFLDDNNPNTIPYMTNSQMLQMHFAARDVMFFAFEPKKYEWLTSVTAETGETEQQLFVPLETTSDGLGESGVFWNWADDDRVTQDAVLSQRPGDLYFAVRPTGGTATTKMKKMQQRCLNLLLSYIENRPATTDQ